MYIIYIEIHVNTCNQIDIYILHVTILTSIDQNTQPEVDQTDN